MCGIVGFTQLGRRPDSSLIRQLTSALHHRGPDQNGIHVSHSVALGAVRLKIIDLAGGDQPIYSADRNTVIVFNGEVYNHNELREELQARGHVFSSRCDTEVVLHAFLEWDTDCFTRLRGMFAVALWDETERRLVLARDRAGIKPLYVEQRGQDLRFGSELKALLLHPDGPRELDHAGLSHYLAFNYVPYPYTLVAGIRKLKPGHWLEWRAGTVREETYWSWPASTVRSRSEGEAKEELDSLLRAAVREHLVSDVPLGIWASGGLDSTTVLHYAAEAVPKLNTFSVSFQGQQFDESSYFRQVAQHYNTQHHEFDLNPEQDIAATIEQMSYYSDEPSADAGALPVWYLSRMTRQHVTVALSGEGADEIFAGYQTYLADKLAQPLRATPSFLRRAALTGLQAWPVSDNKISLEYKAKRMLQGSLLPPDDAHLFWNGTFSAAEREQIAPGFRHRSSAELYQALPAQTPAHGLERYLLLDQHYYLADDILYKCDRMSMAHSLEVRPPFLDHRLLEFAASLPDNLKMRGRTLKYLLRAVMRDKLPPAVLTRPKEGFDIPTQQWFRGPLLPLLRDTVTEQAVRETGVFSWPAIDTLLTRHITRKANYGYHLWGLLTLFLWMRRWKIGASQRPDAWAAANSSSSSLSRP